MNLFNLHTKPESLNNYEHIGKLPENAIKRILAIYARDYPSKYANLARSLGCPKATHDEVQQEDINYVAKSAEWSYYYSNRILNDLFPQGEAAIATSSDYAWQYAYTMIHDRFPEGEEAILLDPRHASMYAVNVIKGRWPEAEAIIASNAEVALQYYKYVYAKTVKHLPKKERRWAAAEETFKTADAMNPGNSYWTHYIGSIYGS